MTGTVLLTLIFSYILFGQNIKTFGIKKSFDEPILKSGSILAKHISYINRDIKYRKSRTDLYSNQERNKFIRSPDEIVFDFSLNDPIIFVEFLNADTIINSFYEKYGETEHIYFGYCSSFIEAFDSYLAEIGGNEYYESLIKAPILIRFYRENLEYIGVTMYTLFRETIYGRELYWALADFIIVKVVGFEPVEIPIESKSWGFPFKVREDIRGNIEPQNIDKLYKFFKIDK